MPIARNNPIPAAVNAGNNLKYIANPLMRDALILYSNAQVLAGHRALDINQFEAELINQALEDAVLTQPAPLPADLDVELNAVFQQINNRLVGTTPIADFVANNLDNQDQQTLLANHARLNPLYQVQNPALRNELMLYALYNAGFNPPFNPTDAQVTTLNNKLATLPLNATNVQFGEAVQNSFALIPNNPQPDNHQPDDHYFQAGNGGFGALPGIQASHNRLLPLYGIESPRIRKILLEYAAGDDGFVPTTQQVYDLNRQLAVPAPKNIGLIDTAIHQIWNIGPQYIQTGYNGGVHAAVVAEIDIIVPPLNKITNPLLRQALIEHAISKAGFRTIVVPPAAAPAIDDAKVKLLNDLLADAAGKTITAANLDTVIGKVWPPGGDNPANTFVASRINAQNIVDQTNRIAPLYRIENPDLRQALIEFAAQTPGFQPRIEEVLRLNRLLFERHQRGTLGHNPVVGDLDADIQAVWLLGPNHPGNNFTTNAILQTQIDIPRYLYNVENPLIRRLLIEHALANPNFIARIDAHPEDITKLNQTLSGLDVSTVDAAALDGVINAIWNIPPQNPHNIVANSNLRDEIVSEHKRIAPLLSIDDPLLRQLFIDYAAAVSDFNPTIEKVVALNKSITNAGGPINSLQLDGLIQAVWTTGANGHPAADLIQISDPGNVLVTEINRIPAALYLVTEPRVKRALINLALTDAGFHNEVTNNPQKITELNIRIASLGINATAANIQLAIDNVWQLGQPNHPGPGFIVYRDDANSFAADHHRIAPLYGIEDTLLRKSMIDHAISKPSFKPTMQTVDALNRGVIGLNTQVPIDLAIVAAFATLPPQEQPDAHHIATTDNMNTIGTQIARIPPELYNITDRTLRQALIEHAIADAGFTATADQVRKLNASVSVLALSKNFPDDGSTLEDVIINGATGAFPVGGNNPANGFMTGRVDVRSIVAKLKRVAPLYAVEDPLLRQALIAHANLTPAFRPSYKEVSILNRRLATLPHPVTAAAIDGVITGVGGVWPHNPANGTPNATFVADYDTAHPGAEITANYETNIPSALFDVAEPLLRQALIAHALDPANAVAFRGVATAENVKKLNEILSTVPAPTTADDIKAALHAVWDNTQAGNPGANFITNHPNRDLIVSQHNSVFPLYNVAVPSIRQALMDINNVLAPPVLNFTAEQVLRFNSKVASAPAPTQNTSLYLDDTIRTAILAPAGRPLAAFNYIQTLDAAGTTYASQANAAIPLQKITEYPLRKALIEHALNPNNLAFLARITPAAIKQLNDRMAKLNPPATAEAITGVINSVWSAADPGNPSDRFIQTRGDKDTIVNLHNRIGVLYKITETPLRDLLIAYSLLNPGFDPKEEHVKKLNGLVAALPPNATSNNFSVAVYDAFTNAPPAHPAITPPGNTYFDAANTPPNDIFVRARTGIGATHTRIALLYGVTEPTLREALIKYALENPPRAAAPGSGFDAIDQRHIDKLNKLVADAHPNATAGNFGAYIQQAFSADPNANPPLVAATNPPAPAYFGQPNAGHEYYAKMNSEHVIAAPFYKIKEPRLRDAFIAYATQEPSTGFTATPDEVKAFNTYLSNSAHKTITEAQFVTEIRTKFASINGSATAFANYFDVGQPGKAAYDEHRRIAPIYDVANEALREALIAYARLNPGFDPSIASITALNTEIANLPAGAISDAVLQGKLDIAFAGMPVYPGRGAAQSYFAVGQPGASALAPINQGRALDTVTQSFNTPGTANVAQANTTIAALMSGNRDKVTAAIANAYTAALVNDPTVTADAVTTKLVDKLKKASNEAEAKSALTALGITTPSKKEVFDLLVENRKERFHPVVESFKVKGRIDHQQVVSRKIQQGTYTRILNGAYDQAKLALGTRPGNKENLRRTAELLLTIKNDLVMYRKYLETLNRDANPANPNPPTRADVDAEYFKRVDYWRKKPGGFPIPTTDGQAAALLLDLDRILTDIDTVLDPNYNPAANAPIFSGSSSVVTTEFTLPTAADDAYQHVEAKLTEYSTAPAVGATIVVPAMQMNQGRDAGVFKPGSTLVTTTHDDARKIVTQRTENPGVSSQLKIYTTTEELERLGKVPKLSRLSNVPGLECFEFLYEANKSFLPTIAGIPGSMSFPLPPAAGGKKWPDNLIRAQLIYLKFKGIAVDPPRGFEIPSDTAVRKFAEAWTKHMSKDFGFDAQSQMKREEDVKESQSHLKLGGN